jgi:hypothetical protein
MDENKNDIIILVMFGMIVVVLIAAFITDTVGTGTNINKNIIKNSDKNENFRLNGNNYLYSKPGNCTGKGCLRKSRDRNQYEHFNGEPYEQNATPYAYEPNDARLSRYGLLPWWNSTRFITRNTSYDIRGDVPFYGSCVGNCAGCSPPLPWWDSPLRPL